MTPDSKLLGNYLKDRRGKLDPANFGISPIRRRTPGLRREEVAQRANVSATWYTWLEQGRGGSPSSEVLNRLAQALELNKEEREHLFLLAQQRPPQVQYQPGEPVSPQLQRVLDSLEHSPALVRTSLWDIVAWNDAARAVLLDYETLAPEERNILRILFCNSRVRDSMSNWRRDVSNVVAVFRAEVIRAGAQEKVQGLVDELCQRSPDFAAIWQGDYDVQRFGEGLKRTEHPEVGEVSFEYSSFAIDGRADLGLVIYTPASPTDRNKVHRLIADWQRGQQVASTEENAVSEFR